MSYGPSALRTGRARAKPQMRRCRRGGDKPPTRQSGDKSPQSTPEASEPSVSLFFFALFALFCGESGPPELQAGENKFKMMSWSAVRHATREAEKRGRDQPGGMGIGGEGSAPGIKTFAPINAYLHRRDCPCFRVQTHRAAPVIRLSVSVLSAGAGSWKRESSTLAIIDDNGSPVPCK